MQPRHILIGLAVIVVAFGVAFGIGKATGGEEAAAGSGPAPEVIQPSSASITADVASERLPALKPKPEKKPPPEETSSGSTTPPSGGTTPPSDGGTTPPSGGTTPPSGGTTPPSGGTTPPSGGDTGGGDTGGGNDSGPITGGGD